jgi:hypothetical protein
LAVANAKSHPISAGGRHETAIAFLTDLEEKLEVAQVQLEVYQTLLPHIDDAPEVGNRIRQLSERLFTMTEVRSSSCMVLLLLMSFVYFSSTKTTLYRLTFRTSSFFASTFLNIGTKGWYDLFGIRSSMRVRISIVQKSVHVLTWYFSSAIVTGRGGAVRLDFQACYLVGSAVLSIRERIPSPYVFLFSFSFHFTLTLRARICFSIACAVHARQQGWRHLWVGVTPVGAIQRSVR